jgi:hypothetical protein
MKYVLLLGKPEFAMKLAEKIKDLRAIVTLANSSKSSKGDVVAVNAAWIDKFGAPYFLQLFKWLEKQNKDEEILKFDSKYPDQVAKCFAQANLSISWKYFLKHGLYNECLNAIHIALMNEKRIKNRHEMLTWCKLITIKNHGNKDRPLDAFGKSFIYRMWSWIIVIISSLSLSLFDKLRKT